MSNGKEAVEQRRHKRFRAQEGAYVLIRGPFSKLGQILNISRGGLEFRYIDIGERPEKLLELDILLKANGFQLEKLPFKTIFDSKATKEIHFISTPMRRRGGQFAALTPKQISALEHFIRNHTVGEVQTVHPQDSRENHCQQTTGFGGQGKKRNKETGL